MERKIKEDLDKASQKTEDNFTKKEVVALFEKFEQDRGHFLAEDAAEILPLDRWLREEGLITDL